MKTQKEPYLALLLSFIVPGVGQFYNGDMNKGFIMLGTAVACMILNFTIIGLILGIPGGFAVWVWGMYDAYKGAQKVNAELDGAGA
ncbi:MAG: hypothetical protein AB1492_03425 [Bacillota bacterium]